MPGPREDQTKNLKLEDLNNKGLDSNSEKIEKTEDSVETSDEKMSLFGRTLEEAYTPYQANPTEIRQTTELGDSTKNPETEDITKKLEDVDQEIDAVKVASETKIDEIKNKRKEFFDDVFVPKKEEGVPSFHIEEHSGAPAVKENVDPDMVLNKIKESSENKEEFSLDNDAGYKKFIQAEALKYLQTYDKEYLDRDYSGVDEDGNLILKNGDKSLPLNNIGGRLKDGQSFTEFTEKTKGRYIEKNPEIEAKMRGLPLEQVLNERKERAIGEIKKSIEERKRLTELYGKPTGGFDEEYLIKQHKESGLLSEADVQEMEAFRKDEVKTNSEQININPELKKELDAAKKKEEDLHNDYGTIVTKQSEILGYEDRQKRVSDKLSEVDGYEEKFKDHVDKEIIIDPEKGSADIDRKSVV